MAVTLVELYNPEWPDWFRQLRAFLEPRLRGVAMHIEHVGSTSVPGMTAKPVIDIDVVVERGAMPHAIQLLESAGYVHEGDLGIPEREAFDLVDEQIKASLPPHHLYVCPQGAFKLYKHLVFRDFLRDHPEHAQRLSDLKWSLCEQFDNDGPSSYRRSRHLHSRSANERKIYVLLGTGGPPVRTASPSCSPSLSRPVGLGPRDQTGGTAGRGPTGRSRAGRCSW
jgi:GrpB-like predicted nucleotidyltransferase (UPF0157 family)